MTVWSQSRFLWGPFLSTRAREIDSSVSQCACHQADDPSLSLGTNMMDGKNQPDCHTRARTRTHSPYRKTQKKRQCESFEPNKEYKQGLFIVVLFNFVSLYWRIFAPSYVLEWPLHYPEIGPHFLPETYMIQPVFHWIMIYRSQVLPMQTLKIVYPRDCLCFVGVSVYSSQRLGNLHMQGPTFKKKFSFHVMNK